MREPNGGVGLNPADRLTRYFLSAREELLRFLRRRSGPAVAEDLLHDAWLRLRERGDPEHWREPRAVIFTTAARLAADLHRRERISERVLAAGHAWQPEQAEPELEVEAAGQLRQLEAALWEIPEVCREAFLLNRIEALSHAEIAQRLGVSTKSVQRYIERALRHCVQRMNP